MVSAHDPENGPGTSGPGNSRPSLTRPRKPAGIAADQQVSRLVTPDTTEKPGRSEYQDNQPGISDKSYQAKRRTPLASRSVARPATRSLTCAEVTVRVRSHPQVSTTRFRFVPRQCLNLSKPMASPPSADCTDWESREQALGSAARCSASLTWAYSASWTRRQVPSFDRSRNHR